jgi:hypothetical protein
VVTQRHVMGIMGMAVIAVGLRPLRPCCRLRPRRLLRPFSTTCDQATAEARLPVPIQPLVGPVALLEHKDLALLDVIVVVRLQQEQQRVSMG